MFVYQCTRLPLCEANILVTTFASIAFPLLIVLDGSQANLKSINSGFFPIGRFVDSLPNNTSHTTQSKARNPQVTTMSSTTLPDLLSSPNLPNITTLVIYTPLIYLLIILLPILLNPQNPNLPPGPWYTRFTNLVLKYHEWNGNRRIYIHDLHKSYGESIRIGVKEFAFCGVEGVKGVYGNEGGELDKTGFYGLFRQLGVRTTFSTERRLEHKEKKKNIAKPYRNSEIIKPAIMDGIEERSQAFLRKVEDSENGVLDFYRYAHCFALDCASHFLLGTAGTKSIEEKAGMEIMEEMTYHSSLRSKLLPFHFYSILPLYFPQSTLSTFQSHTLTDQLLTLYLQPLSTFFLSLFPQRSTPLTNTYILTSCLHPTQEPHTLLHALQHASPSLSETQIAAEILDHLAAGLDTTGASLTYLLHTLSLPSNLPIQEKLHLSLTSPPKNTTQSETPYLNALITETLRLHPPIPMSQPRLTSPSPSKPRIIAQYLIPPNSTVSIQAWSLHRNPAIFGNDAEMFCPERWLGNEERVREMERGFLAFGRGGRACTGRDLALAEMRHLIQRIYTKYRTKTKEGYEADMEMEDQIISSRPRGQECKLIFERR
ncbi:uncharacterized protein EAF01_005231 [Botrytis porri]|uniref:uncharacterized protein n=1 Tax=Botrytis porri TaxID=87229 RepID=UPI001902909C|nr:uncharacterized protein EAF01_005231 [Botrytis porri]KAF7907645.1 hypothetical protein EAF01_005231 [Botrytis porri]